jgi:protein-S-isoprenylcysteine O-methyltransferase Ste14
MSGETPFRLLLIVLAVVQAAVSLWFLRGTGAGATIFGRREEGLLLTVGVALCYLAYGGAVVVYLLNPAWMDWSAVAIPSWLRWAGIVPVLAGAVGIIQSQRHLGRNITISISTKNEHALVTTGPYARVRHPMYSAGTVESVGVCLLTANWFVAVSAGLFWMLIALRTPLEEQKLIEKFGEAYRDYVRRVGRFVPRVTERP